MHIPRAAAAPVLALCLSAANPTNAGILVTPGIGEAQYTIQQSVSTFSPLGRTRIEPLSGPDFAGASSMTTIGAPATQMAASGADFTAEIFRAFTGPVDYIRFRGGASASAILSPSSAAHSSAAAQSTIFNTFTVTEPVIYTLSGFITITDAAGAGAGGGLTSAALVLRPSPGGPIAQLNLSAFETATLPIAFSGTLMPGEYRLSAHASAAATAFAAPASWTSAAAYDLRIDFAPVPAPATLALLPILSLALHRRRKA